MKSSSVQVAGTWAGSPAVTLCRLGRVSLLQFPHLETGCYEEEIMFCRVQGMWKEIKWQLPWPSWWKCELLHSLCKTVWQHRGTQNIHVIYVPGITAFIYAQHSCKSISPKGIYWNVKVSTTYKSPKQETIQYQQNGEMNMVQSHDDTMQQNKGTT